MANDVGVLTAVDATSGERVWQERVDGVFSASPVAGGGHVYFVSENGETVVVKAGPGAAGRGEKRPRRARRRVAGDLERADLHPHRQSRLRDRAMMQEGIYVVSAFRRTTAVRLKPDTTT